MEPTPNPRSVGAVLKDIVSRLEQKGIDAPRLSAQLLIAHALHTSRLEILLQRSRPLSRNEFLAVQELAHRREQGEPAAYILGEKEFYGRAFVVCPEVLVPRPETELIVDLVKQACAPQQPFVFADIGTGSGNLAVTLAAEFPGSQGVALDLSLPALALARINIGRHGLGGRLLPVCADLALGVARRGVDLVVANPPYLSEQEYQSASREVSGYEPRQALVGGDRGDELSRRLLESCGEVLRPGGRLFMEGSEKRTADLARIATMEPGVWAEAAVVKDLGGQDRILALRRM